jgi:putative membrane protein
MMGSNWGYGNSFMGGGWLLMLLFGALVVAGVVVLVVWAVRASSGHAHGSGQAPVPPAAAPGHDEAVAIAKRRFAAGEIDKDQYEEIMRALNS